MIESLEIRVMRAMAIKRAKGELEAALQTYYSLDESSKEEFDIIKQAICYLDQI